MKYSELKTLTKDALLTKLQETEKELFNLRFKRAQQQLESPAKLRQLRHLVSQIHTVLHTQELAQQKPALKKETVKHA